MIQAMEMMGWLVVTGTMEFDVSINIGNFIIPTDEVHHFSEG